MKSAFKRKQAKRFAKQLASDVVIAHSLFEKVGLTSLK